MAWFVLPPEFIPEVSTVVNFIMSFTPLLSYGSTVLSIRRKRSSQGFSIDICATMLIASILRIAYYINDPFEVALLRQCLVMVFIQTILLQTALKYRSLDEVTFEIYSSDWKSHWDLLIDTNESQFAECSEKFSDLKEYDLLYIVKVVLSELVKFIYNNVVIFGGVTIQLVKEVVRLFDHHFIRPFNFWQWENPISYWKFLAGFILTLGVVQLIFNGSEHLGITLGSISFLVESSLPLPQILLFQRVQNVDNFKTILLLSWLGGDFTKISYLIFGTDNIGFLFIIAAFFQMSLNLVITYQFFYYKLHPSIPAAEAFDLPLRHEPARQISRSDTLGSQQYDLNFHREQPLRAISISSFLPQQSNIPLIPQQQHFLDNQDGSTDSGYSVNDREPSILESDLADIDTPLTFEIGNNKINSSTNSRGISFDLGSDNADIIKSRSSTLK